MSLLVYNLTIAPLPLAAGVPIATLPASASAGSRGPALNVTGELKGQLAPAFALLQAQVALGQVQYEWSGLPEFNTFTLVVGSAQTDVSDLPIDIYVDPAGSDTNPGTAALPFQTLVRALEAMPAEWRVSAHINLAAGAYTMPTNSTSFGTPLGGASPLVIIGTPLVVKNLTDAAGGSTSVVTDLGAGMVIDEYVGAELLCTAGANAGQAISIRRNTATTVTLNGLFLAPNSAGSTFEIRRPDSTINFSVQIGIFRSTFAMAHVKTVGSFDIVQSQVSGMRNVEFDLTAGGFIALPGGTIAVFGGFGPGGAFNNDPTAPFSFFSFQSGVYLNTTDANSGMGTSPGTLRASFLVVRNGYFVADACSTQRIHGLAVLNGYLAASGSAVIEQVPNGIFGFYPGALDGTVVDIAASKVFFNFIDISNSPSSGIDAKNGSFVVANGVSGVGNAGYGLKATEMSQILTGLGTSVTGAAGDTLVGAVPKAYVALPYGEINGSGPTLNRIQ